MDSTLTLVKLNFGLDKICPFQKGQSNSKKYIGTRNKKEYFIKSYEKKITDNSHFFYKYNLFLIPKITDEIVINNQIFRCFEKINNSAIRLDKFFSESKKAINKKNQLKSLLTKLESFHNNTIKISNIKSLSHIGSNLDKNHKYYFEKFTKSQKKVLTCTVHGDFHLKNIFSYRNNFYLTDFDLVKENNPLIIDYVKLETSFLIHCYSKSAINFFEKGKYNNFLCNDSFLSITFKEIYIIRKEYLSICKKHSIDINKSITQYLAFLYYYFCRFITNKVNSKKNKVFVERIVLQMENTVCNNVYN